MMGWDRPCDTVHGGFGDDIEYNRQDLNSEIHEKQQIHLVAIFIYLL